MNVRNLQDYVVIESTGPRFDVALAPFAGAQDETTYFSFVVEALRAHPHVNRINTHWTPDRSEEGFDPSHIVRVSIQPTYGGSGWNFPITFPGFLVFTCAWLGYYYTVDLDTTIFADPLPSSKSQMSAAGMDAEVLTSGSKEFESPFYLKHCSYTRGFWSGSGWWFPGYGATALVFAFVHTGYDRQATQPFQDAIRAQYGRYVAENIIQVLRDGGAVEYQQFRKSGT